MRPTLFGSQRALPALARKCECTTQQEKDDGFIMVSGSQPFSNTTRASELSESSYIPAFFQHKEQRGDSHPRRCGALCDSPFLSTTQFLDLKLELHGYRGTMFSAFFLLYIHLQTCDAEVTVRTGTCGDNFNLPRPASSRRVVALGFGLRHCLQTGHRTCTVYV